MRSCVQLSAVIVKQLTSTAGSYPPCLPALPACACSNAEFLEFVRDGGYRSEQWWSGEGWRWRTFRNAKWPCFWVPDGPQGARLVLRCLCAFCAVPSVLCLLCCAFCAVLRDCCLLKVVSGWSQASGSQIPACDI